ncbi:MAG: phytoene desaturase [Bacteroidetes bacterium]|nr:phytoene desaturase [Bacteroidota bacterium]
MQPNKHVGIIGAGIAGLATAIRLASKGLAVEVFEANAYPGGKLSEVRLEDYRFDAGPSLFTLPQQVEELFIQAGLKPDDYFCYRRLSLTCRYFYEDGTIINGHADPEAFAGEIAQKTGARRQDVARHIRHSARLYHLLADLFMHRSLHDWRTWLSPKSLRAYLNLPFLGIHQSMHKANTARLKAPKAVQLFNRYATYNGSNPYQAPATLNIIPHLEMGIGAYMPEGGMHAITLSLYELAKKLGVQFYFSSPVSQILTENNKVTGLLVKGETHAFAQIVSNGDLLHTYRKLLPRHKAPERLLQQPKSSSALIFYWGIRREFPALDLHNIFFSEDYREEFRHIFEEKTIWHDPTVYINITSKFEKGDAPSGCENWFTMINVPHNSGQDWDQLIADARQNILKKLSRILGTAIEPLIAEEAILDPRTIESKTSSAYGALYGNSSNSRYAAFLRHANKSSTLEGLYFCGGSVHPGGGIPLCLLSAKITAEMVKV